MKSEEIQIKNRLVDLSFQPEQSHQFDYKSHLINQSMTQRQNRPQDDVSQWYIKSARQVQSTDNLQGNSKQTPYKRASFLDNYALPRITARNAYNSTSLNSVINKTPVHSALLQDPPFSYFSSGIGEYNSCEAVIINKEKMRQTQHRVNTVYLKLAYESPASKLRSIIHNNSSQAPSVNGSFDIMKKIQKKKKQIELAAKLKESQLINSKDHTQKQIHRTFQRYPFQRKILDILEPQRQHKRRSRRRRG